MSDVAINLEAINQKIKEMQQSAEALEQLGSHFPAMRQNTKRILASLKMLEINIVDAFELGLVE